MINKPIFDHFSLIYALFLAVFGPKIDLFAQCVPWNVFLRPIIDNKTIQDEKVSEKKVFLFNVSKIGTNVNQLYFNKVDTSLSRVRTSCLGYKMMAVAKIWGL